MANVNSGVGGGKSKAQLEKEKKEREERLKRERELNSSASSSSTVTAGKGYVIPGNTSTNPTSSGGVTNNNKTVTSNPPQAVRSRFEIKQDQIHKAENGGYVQSVQSKTNTLAPAQLRSSVNDFYDKKAIGKLSVPTVGKVGKPTIPNTRKTPFEIKQEQLYKAGNGNYAIPTSKETKTLTKDLNADKKVEIAKPKKIFPREYEYSNYEEYAKDYKTAVEKYNKEVDKYNKQIGVQRNKELNQYVDGSFADFKENLKKSNKQVDENNKNNPFFAYNPILTNAPAQKQVEELQKRQDKLNSYESVVNTIDFKQYKDKGKNEVFNKAKNADMQRDTYGDLSNKTNDVHLTFMDDEQRGIYDYYVGKGEVKKADEYVKLIHDQLNSQHGKYKSDKILKQPEMLKNINTTMLSVDSGVQGSFTGMKQAGNRFVGNKEPIPRTATEHAQDHTRPQLSGVQGLLSDVGNSVGYMAPGIVASAVTGLPLVGAVVQGVGSGGQAYNMARRDGYDDKQALTYGVVTGALESTTQYLLGGIGKLGKGGISKVLGRGTLSKIDDVFMTFAKNPQVYKALAGIANVGRKSFDEALEEWTQANLDPILRNVVFDENNEIKPFSEDKLYAAMLGAVTGFTMNVTTGDMSMSDNARSNYNKVVDNVKLSDIDNRYQSMINNGMFSDNASRDANVDMDIASSILQNHGVEVEFVEDLDSNINGMYKDSKVLINKKSKQPFLEVAKHELTHHIENSDSYSGLVDFVTSYMNENNVDVDAVKSSLANIYADNGIVLDERGVTNELVSKFVGSKLFQNDSSIDRLAQTDPTLFNIVKNWISDMAVKLTGTSEDKTYRDLEKKYINALGEVKGKQLSSDNTNYYISKDSNGDDVSVITTDIFEGKKGSNQYKVVRDYINGHVNEFYNIAQDDNAVYIGKDLPNEFTQSKATKDLSKNKLLLKAKNQSSQNLGEMIEIAKDAKFEKNNKLKHSVDAKNGWYKYNTRFAIPIKNVKGEIDYHRIFSAELVIRHDADNKKYLYDVQKITKEDQPLVSTPKGQLSLSQNSFVDDIIPRNNKIVNTNKTQSSNQSSLSNDDFDNLINQHVPPTQMSEQYKPVPINTKGDTIDISYDYSNAIMPNGEVKQAPKRLQNLNSNLKKTTVNGLSDLFGISKDNDFLENVIDELQDIFDSSNAPINVYVDGNAPVEEQTQERLDNIFNSLVNNGVVETSNLANDYADLKKYFKNTGVAVTSQSKSEFENYNQTRKSLFGKLRIANNGVPVDNMYSELQELYPELFKNELVGEKAKLDKIIEVTKSLVKTEEKLNIYAKGDNEYKNSLKLEWENIVDEFFGTTKIQDEAKEDYYKRNANKWHYAYDIPINEMIGIYDDFFRVKRVYETNPIIKKLNGDNIKTLNPLTQDVIDTTNTYLKILNSGTMTLEDVELIAEISDNNSIDYEIIKEAYEVEKSYKSLSSVVERFRTQNHNARIEKIIDLTQNSALWKDKKNAVQYHRERFDRNLADIMKDDKQGYKDIVEQVFKPIQENEASKWRYINSELQKVEDLNLNNIESSLVQLLGEKMVTDIEVMGIDLNKWRDILKSNDVDKIKDTFILNKLDIESKSGRKKLLGDIQKAIEKSNKIDTAKLQKANTVFRKIYDETYSLSRESALKAGEVFFPYRKDYYPHFTQREINSEIPTSIAGRTGDRKPNKPWFSNAQSRTGNKTVYDANANFERYIKGAAELIYHTDDIKNIREMSEQIRQSRSSDEIKTRLQEIFNDKNLTIDEKRAKRTEILELADSEVPNLVKYLDEYANQLAGKKSKVDRAVEEDYRRKIYDLAKFVDSQSRMNLVGHNVSSALSNFIPLLQAGSFMPKKHLVKATGDYVKGKLNHDSFADGSTFLTSRKGQEVFINPSLLEKFNNTQIMTIVDDMVSEILVRGKYNEEMSKHGSHTKAMEIADEFVSKAMGDRSLGTLPTLFGRKNPISSFINAFQVEVNNQYSYFAKDIPKIFKAEPKKAVGYLIQYILASYLYDEFSEETMGRKVLGAYNPIGVVKDFAKSYERYKQGEIKASDVVDGVLEQVSNTLPFVSNITGLLGIEGGRIPITSAVPDLKELLKVAYPEYANEKKFEILLNELVYKLPLALSPVAGMGQLKKTVQNTVAYAQGGSYKRDNEGNKILQYPIERNVENLIKGTLFGKSATDEGKEWVSSGFNSFSANETKQFDRYKKNYKDLTNDEILNIISMSKQKQGERKFERGATLTQYLYSLDLSEKEVNKILWDSGFNDFPTANIARDTQALQRSFGAKDKDLDGSVKPVVDADSAVFEAVKIKDGKTYIDGVWFDENGFYDVNNSKVGDDQLTDEQKNVQKAVYDTTKGKSWLSLHYDEMSTGDKIAQLHKDNTLWEGGIQDDIETPKDTVAEDTLANNGYADNNSGVDDSVIKSIMSREKGRVKADKGADLVEYLFSQKSVNINRKEELLKENGFILPPSTIYNDKEQLKKFYSLDEKQQYKATNVMEQGGSLDEFITIQKKTSEESRKSAIALLSPDKQNVLNRAFYPPNYSKRELSIKVAKLYKNRKMYSKDEFNQKLFELDTMPVPKQIRKSSLQIEQYYELKDQYRRAKADEALSLGVDWQDFYYANKIYDQTKHLRGKKRTLLFRQLVNKSGMQFKDLSTILNVFNLK